MAKDYRLATRIEERNNEAKRLEQAGKIPAACRLYEQNIREDYADKTAFERLMVIYRKQKDYKNELKVIDRGIEVFKEQIAAHVKQSLSRRLDSKKLELLSNAIIKKSGLQKQTSQFPDPIDKWLKRKEVVKQKMKK